MKHSILTLLLCLATIVSTAQEKKTMKLVNSNGMEAVITNYGARLMRLTAHNWNGRLEPIVKGYAQPEDYEQNPTLGATTFGFGETKNHELARKIWEVTAADNQTISMRCSIDKGETTVTVVYTLTDQNALDIDYRITCKHPTELRITNGIVFNLTGDCNRSILKEHLWLDSRHINTSDPSGCPTGKLESVKHTAMNFIHPHELGERIGWLDNGYHQAFQLKHPDDIRRPAAILFDAQSGRAMTVYTSEPTLRINSHGPASTGISFQPLSCGYKAGDTPVETTLLPGLVFHSATVFLFTTAPPVIMKPAQENSQPTQ